MHTLRHLALTTTFALLTGHAWANGKSFPVQGRLFVGANFINPTDLNQEMSAAGLKEFENIVQYGAEITFAATSWLDVGGRYVRHGVDLDENPTNAGTTYTGSIRQDSIIFLARVPLVRSKFFKFDIFGGVGGGNSTFTIKTASLDGKLTRAAASKDWYATPIFATGASMGVGFKKFYFFVEGGYEQNNVSKMIASGTLSTGVTRMNLTGPYVMIGLLFDGVEGHK